jgi:hypothetical protein
VIKVTGKWPEFFTEGSNILVFLPAAWHGKELGVRKYAFYVLFGGVAPEKLTNNVTYFLIKICTNV